MSISDLARQAELSTPLMRELSEQQERELVSDRKLLLVAALVVNGMSLGEILDAYNLTQAEAIKRLTTLDRLKLIELLPNNRIKLLIAANFAWRKNGPIEEFFARNVQREFLKSRFDQPGEGLLFLYGLLSERSNAIIQRRMEQLAKEFNDLNAEDTNRPIEERRGSSMILAIRPWDYFADHRRPESSK